MNYFNAFLALNPIHILGMVVGHFFILVMALRLPGLIHETRHIHRALVTMHYRGNATLLVFRYYSLPGLLAAGAVFQTEGFNAFRRMQAPDLFDIARQLGDMFEGFEADEDCASSKDLSDLCMTSRGNIPTLVERA